MSVGTKERRFKVYNALEVTLRRGKVEKAGAVATLLLECFVEDSGRLQSSKVVARGLCEEGKFTAWRDEMVKNGWLVWSQYQSDKGQYFAGKKLGPYLNKEKASEEVITRREILPKETIATKDELNTKADKSDLEATNLRLEMTQKQLESAQKTIQEIADAVRELQEAMTPPDNPHKESIRKKSAQKIASLTSTH